MKTIINTEKAPKAIGPYSQAVEANGTLYISGQLPIDVATSRLVDGGVKEQAEQCLKNIGYILDAAGYTFDNVVKSTCLLSDIAHFAEMNEVYTRYYAGDCPARAAFAVKALPAGALVEIETIAVK
ncbi:MAG: RidA family protein [Odoribacteraceae bacterium]|jgi:2-iminobutanoate/2-iminopropanoate deaminase|nr:RidA family protein [Odoribacteraceae bacterium]